MNKHDPYDNQLHEEMMHMHKIQEWLIEVESDIQEMIGVFVYTLNDQKTRNEMTRALNDFLYNLDSGLHKYIELKVEPYGFTGDQVRVVPYKRES